MTIPGFEQQMTMEPNNYFGQKGFPEMSQSPASTCSPENNSFSSREHCLLNDNENQVFLSFQHWESLQIATEWLKPGSVRAGRLIQKKKALSLLSGSHSLWAGLFYSCHPGSRFLHLSEVLFHQNENPKCNLTTPVTLPWRFLWEAGMSSGSFPCSVKYSSFWLLLSLKVSNGDSPKYTKKEKRQQKNNGKRLRLSLLDTPLSAHWKHEEQEVFGP